MADVIKELQKHISQFDRKENFLRHQKWVAKLIKDGKMEAAMKRAETLDRSGASNTDVWKAIKVFGFEVLADVQLTTLSEYLKGLVVV